MHQQHRNGRRHHRGDTPKFQDLHDYFHAYAHHIFRDARDAQGSGERDEYRGRHHGHRGNRDDLHHDHHHEHHDHHHMHDHHRSGMFHAGWHFLERLHDRFPLHAMRQRGRGDGPGRHGFGGMGGLGGMGGDGDGDGFNRGRKVSSQDLQLLLLALLADKPAHGYELIKALETLSNGFYAPSPGMVYPALTYLEELGLLTVTQEGNRKSYSLSEAGREHLAQNKDRVDMMLAKLEHIGAKMDSMRRAYSGEAGADEDEGGWLPELIEAKHALKKALWQRINSKPEEQKRIAEVLMQAARAITGI